MKTLFALLLTLVAFATPATAVDPWITLPGGEGVGKGKKIVLVSGDEEYRSEEALPQLAKILSKHHGFECTVLFAIDKKDGETINPVQTDNIPGLTALESADAMIVFTRFRNLPNDQLKHFEAYLKTGKPIVGLRTATHAFNLSAPKNGAEPSPYAYMHWQSKIPGWEGGFGRQILGETWVAHHGSHGKEGTRGVPAPGQESHPILKGIESGSIFGTSDVYTVRKPLIGDTTPIVLGQVTDSLKPDSVAVSGKKNDPMMPIAWTKTYMVPEGTKGRVFTTTMGASQDLVYEGTRRMIVNGTLWSLGLEEKIPEKSNVEIVGDYQPLPFKFGGFKPGVKPADLLK